MPAELARIFPQLESAPYKVTSPEDVKYNCVAWAAGPGEVRRKWWLAVYADETDTPTHMARQLPTGYWTSKLGELEDIQHVGLDQLNCRDSRGAISQAENFSRGSRFAIEPRPLSPLRKSRRTNCTNCYSAGLTR